MQKQLRLRSNADFQRVRREGQTLVHPLLVISVLPNHLDHSRFGFAVGRRLGTAVDRNRCKRRLREAVRLQVQAGRVAAGWDVVLVARSPLREATFQEIDGAVALLLRRAGVV